MPRRPCHRRICYRPPSLYFKPRGVPLCELKVISLKEDEMEAIRLADFEGMYHEQASQSMKVSRQTFDRIVNRARKKIAEALVLGAALEIQNTQSTESKHESNSRSCK